MVQPAGRATTNMLLTDNNIKILSPFLKRKKAEYKNKIIVNYAIGYSNTTFSESTCKSCTTNKEDTITFGCGTTGCINIFSNGDES